MPQIKIRENLESFYKVRTLLILSVIITFLLENRVIKYLYDPELTDRFNSFFTNSSLIVLYGTLIGLLLTAYSLIVSIVSMFSSDSLKKPIFSQVNDLFVFTILDGIFLLLIFFTGNFIPGNYSYIFLDIEIFFFLCFLIGIIFCVLTISDMFKIVSNRGLRK